MLEMKMDGINYLRDSVITYRDLFCFRKQFTEIYLSQLSHTKEIIY